MFYLFQTLIGACCAGRSSLIYLRFPSPAPSPPLGRGPLTGAAPLRPGLFVSAGRTLFLRSMVVCVSNYVAPLALQLNTLKRAPSWMRWTGCITTKLSRWATSLVHPRFVVHSCPRSPSAAKSASIQDLVRAIQGLSPEARAALLDGLEFPHGFRANRTTALDP
jgi:hypothetical protein